MLFLATLGVAACGASATPATSATTPVGAHTDEAPATDDRYVAHVSAAELQARLADGTWRRWGVEPTQVTENYGPERGGLTATATSITASQCRPGGGVVEFFIDEQQRVLSHATYYTYAPQDHAGHQISTPANRCFREQYPLAAGQIYYGELEVTP